MKKFEIKSVFEQISTEVFKMSNVNEAKHSLMNSLPPKA
jgi:hypothetical protein